MNGLWLAAIVAQNNSNIVRAAMEREAQIKANMTDSEKEAFDQGHTMGSSDARFLRAAIIVGGLGLCAIGIGLGTASYLDYRENGILRQKIEQEGKDEMARDAESAVSAANALMLLVWDSTPNSIPEKKASPKADGKGDLMRRNPGVLRAPPVPREANSPQQKNFAHQRKR